MGLKEESEFLQSIPLFANVELSKLKLLAFTSDRLTFAEGEVLFEQGTIGDFVYVILSGDADVVMESPAGPLHLATLNEHQIVGEIAVLCDMPRTATVRAKTELTTLRITKAFFTEIAFEYPHIAVEIMRSIAQRLEITTVRLSQAIERAVSE